MNKKGFTLMELLLVVAVLAIVAAAAAPTFFGGAEEAMREAKKSSFMSAYQNTLSGANLMVSIAASQGIIPANETINLTENNPLGTNKTLDNYVPEAARVFNLGDNNVAGILTAKYENNIVYVYNSDHRVELKPNTTYTYNQICNLVTTGNAN